MNVRQNSRLLSVKRKIDSQNQDRERQYAEEQFMARHARERLDELIARNAPEEMIRRLENEIKAYGSR